MSSFSLFDIDLIHFTIGIISTNANVKIYQHTSWCKRSCRGASREDNACSSCATAVAQNHLLLRQQKPHPSEVVRFNLSGGPQANLGSTTALAAGMIISYLGGTYGSGKSDGDASQRVIRDG